jgi:[histone H3]-trimethyl-L-lysine4 demethylase
MEGATRSNMSYLDKLAKFHRQQGTTLTKLPSLDKQPIDLYQLKKCVDVRGGFKAVCQAKKWAEIGRELGYGNIKNVTSVSTSLKNAFLRYLLPYETYLEKAKPEFLREMGLTPSPQRERKESDRTPSGTPSGTPTGIGRNLMEQIQEEDAKMHMDGMLVKREASGDLFETTKEESPSPVPNGSKRTFEETTTRSASICTETEKDEPVRRESKRLKKGISLSYTGNVRIRTYCC